MLKRVAVVNIALVLFGLYFCESTIRVLDGTAERDLKMALGWKPLMPVWHPEVAELQDKHQLPLLGSVPNQKTILCNDGYGLVSYNSDRYGFRNRNSDYLKSEVLIIGDSFLHGWCHKEDPGSFLRSRGFSAINISMAGYHPYQYSASLESFASLLKPKVVVLGIYLGNDYGVCDKCASRYSRYRDQASPIYTLNGDTISPLSPEEKSRYYYRELSQLAVDKYRLVLGNSISYFFKLGKLRQRAARLFTGAGTGSTDIYKPYVDPKGVQVALRSLNEACNQESLCVPIIVSVPSNEPGESLVSRNSIERMHLSLVSEFLEVSPRSQHLRLDSKKCGKLFDEPGRHLSPRANDCMNNLILSAINSAHNKNPSTDRHSPTLYRRSSL